MSTVRQRWVGSIAMAACALMLAACGSSGSTEGSATSGVSGGSSSINEDTNSDTDASSAENPTSTVAKKQNMESQTREGRPSLKEFCGTKPAKVAYIVGFGDNAWRKTTLAEIEDEAGQCSNVEVTYMDANGDQNQYLANVNSATAQGYNAIITYDDFGAAAVPAFRAAYQAGVAVVPFEADPTGTVGSDYTGFVALDTKIEAKNWADFFSRALPDGGKIAFFGGTPGAPLSQNYWDDFSADIESTPNISLEGSGPITTNWTPADSQKAASGLFSQFPDTSAAIVDYLGGGGSAVVNAFITAGKPLVPIAGGSATNQLVCQYHDLKDSNPNFQLFSMDGDISMGRVALRQAVAAYEGIDNPESWVYQRSVGIDTTSGVVPDCESNLPADLPLNSQLNVDQLEKVFS